MRKSAHKPFNTHKTKKASQSKHNTHSIQIMISPIQKNRRLRIQGSYQRQADTNISCQSTSEELFRRVADDEQLLGTHLLIADSVYHGVPENITIYTTTSSSTTLSMPIKTMRKKNQYPFDIKRVATQDLDKSSQ